MNKGLLDRLAGHQRMAKDILDRARPMLGENSAPAPLEMGRLRWQLVRTLAAYQQFKHRELFDPAITRGSVQLARMGEALKADCVEIGDAFTDYVRQWSGRSTGAEWPAYRAAALAMIARIDRHLEREQRNVASLLRAGSIAAAPVWRERPR